LAILNGLVNGASLDEIGRDLSSYLGYLALLPVLCIVRKPEQARKVLLLLVLVGLPAFVLSQLVWIGRKQDLASASLPYFPAATAYWEPIQGTLWAIAISHKDNGKKIAAWGWICITSLIIVLGGYRTYFIALCLAGATAFLGGGKLSRDSMAKYLIPLFLSLIVGGLLADLAGLVKLPLSRITRDRYATMLSSNNLKEDTSIQGRVFETKILMEGFMQNPFLGIGFGHRIIRGENKRVIGWLSFRPHNGYAEILMKFGIFGTLVFGWYFMVILRMAYRCMANGDTYFSKAVALGVLIWLIPSFAISLAGSLFSDRGFSLTVGIMAGILPALAGQHIFQKDSIRAERIRVYAPQA
jgi:O-antigen ligase